MADAPVELDASTPNDGGSSFLRGFSTLPMLRQVGLMLALAASVAVGFSVVLWMREPDYKPLTGVVGAQQANQIADLLQSEGFPYKLDHDTGMLLVPADKLFAARMKIAGAQIAGGGEQAGFELLDKDQGFGVSQFMEAALHRRSLEGELARSITTIQGVRQARVHLGIPRATGFVRDQRAPTASVTVTLGSGQTLAEGQVRAIMNLVAGAVPELAAEHVAVVDQSGRLLSGQDDDKALADADRQLRYTKQIEASLQDKIRNILLPAVGTGRLTAEVAADVDFTWVEETEELFNPDLPALRSEQTMTEQRVGDPIDGGIPGALSNQPPAVSSAPETLAAATAAATAPAATANGAAAATTAPAQPPHRSRSEATRNFELDRTISHTRHQVGRISRLTVAVVVDDMPGPAGENGQVTYSPWKEADLERLSALVKNAIGYNAARGDTVTVVNSPFREERAEAPESIPFYAQTWFVDVIKQVLGALLLLALLFGLLRPLFKSLSKAGAQVPTDRALARLAGPNGGGRIYDDHFYQDRDGMRRVLPGAGAPYDAQLQAVRGLVADNPARVAQVVKHWVSKDE